MQQDRLPVGFAQPRHRVVDQRRDIGPTRRVGVGIGLFQALTQIQEATLVYAPKIVAIFISLLIFLPLMGSLMSGFMKNIAGRIAGM